MLILTLHISVALVMTIATLGVFAAGYARRESKAYTVMLASFGVTVFSGIGLLFVSNGALGRFCAMMSAFTVSVLIARAYYRKRLTAANSL